jgi:uncharacterized integral membrane protein (TIGR00698 family)
VEFPVSIALSKYAAHVSSHLLRHLISTAPGIALAGAIVLLSFAARALPGFSLLSPMILAILIGIGFHNLIGTPYWALAGVKYSMRHILRFAVAMLGLQLTTQQLAEVGATGVLLIFAALASTFLFTKWLGRRLGVEDKLAELIAAGTSICGASAVAAVNTVTDAHDEDVAYAVACVTLFGSLSMFVYPMLPGLLHMAPRAFGLWAGSSIHEIAQVVAATFQDGKLAGEFGTIAKLARVSMLAPVVLLLAFRRNAGTTQSGRKPALPLFVAAFVALVLLNSVLPPLPVLHRDAALFTSILLSLALAAMGLETDIRKLAAKGLRPLLLGALSTGFIACFSLYLVKTFAGR